MVKITSSNFSITQICQSGQCFRMNEMEAQGGQRVSLVAHGRYMEILQSGDDICFDCTQEEYDTLWKLSLIHI